MKLCRAESLKVGGLKNHDLLPELVYQIYRLDNFTELLTYGDKRIAGGKCCKRQQTSENQIDWNVPRPDSAQNESLYNIVSRWTNLMA